MIQSSFTSSKWNMGEILPFLGLKMMVKSGVKKSFWNSFMPKPIFGPVHLFYKKRDFCPKCQIQYKKSLFPMEGFQYFSTYDIWNFKSKISPMFHFELVNEGWIIAILCVKNMHVLLQENNTFLDFVCAETGWLISSKY